MTNTRIKRKLEKNEPVFGTFFKFNSPTMVELMGLAGFDFIIIDREHSYFSHGDVENLVRTAELMNMSTMIRTPDAHETNILHPLDSGASGVQVPSLHTVEEVLEVIKHAKYNPRGSRGSAVGSRAARYGTIPAATYLKQANEDTLVSIHIENVDTVRLTPELCKIEDLDVLFIGTGDLSQSMGLGGQGGHPKIKEAFDYVTETAIKAGKHVGAIASNKEQLERFLDQGIRYISWQSDQTMIRGMLRAAAENFKPFQTAE